MSDADSPLWFPGLAERLISLVPQDLSANYSTSRFVADVKPQTTFTVGASSASEGPNFRVEVLPKEVEARFASHGLDLLAAKEAAHPRMRALLRNASRLIGESPSLTLSIQLLAKSVHLLKQDAPSTDVSFSDPSIPFSIFVSVCPDAELAPYRLAEAIIHESMHLQLTLIEKTVVLLRQEDSTFYSPWKQSRRPALGLLHALYVFGVIDQWLKVLGASGTGVHYVQRRRVEIASEIALVDHASLKTHIDEEGQELLKRIVDQP